MDALDNPVWHALTGPHQTVAERRSQAARYDPDVAPFAAIADVADSTAWTELRELVGPQGIAVLFVPPTAIPDGWEEAFRFEATQMVATAVEPAATDEAHLLTVDDVPAMLELVERTQPGPFAKRTIELGDYIGVRGGDGALVAMAGQRLRLPGYREISAVCTDERARGRGLATALVRDMAGRIVEHGDIPMLHVMSTNTKAIRLYERLGFTIRVQREAVGLRAPASDDIRRRGPSTD